MSEGTSDIINLSITIVDAYNKLINSNVFEYVDKRIIQIGENKIYIVVGQKFYMRAKNYASATVIFEEVEQNTKMSIIVSGAGESIFNVSWGANTDFYNKIYNVFSNDIKR